MFLFSFKCRCFLSEYPKSLKTTVTLYYRLLWRAPHECLAERDSVIGRPQSSKGFHGRRGDQVAAEYKSVGFRPREVGVPEENAFSRRNFSTNRRQKKNEVKHRDKITSTQIDSVTGY